MPPFCVKTILVKHYCFVFICSGGRSVCAGWSVSAGRCVPVPSRLSTYRPHGVCSSQLTKVISILFFQMSIIVLLIIHVYILQVHFESGWGVHLLENLLLPMDCTILQTPSGKTNTFFVWNCICKLVSLLCQIDSFLNTTSPNLVSWSFYYVKRRVTNWQGWFIFIFLISRLFF